MQHELEIEMQIWDYVDKRCNEPEAKRIELLIKTDDLWKQKFIEITMLHQNIESIELEQPHMRFSRNVMEAIADEKMASTAKGYLNKWVLVSIISFFAVAICYSLSHMLVLLNVETNRHGFYGFRLQQISSFFSPASFVFLLLVLNIITALILIDAMWKRKRSLKSL